MLYDNALLAHAYLEGFRATGDGPIRARRARDARLHARRDAAPPTAASPPRSTPTARASRDAFYAWTRDELTPALADAGLDDDERRGGGRLLGRDRAGQLGGNERPPRAGAPIPAPSWSSGRAAALLAARAARDPTRRATTSRSPSWNGLALRALAHGALVLGDERLPRCDAIARRLRRAPARARRRPPVAHGARRPRPARRRSPRTTSPSPTGCWRRTPRSATRSRCCSRRRLVDTAIRDFWDDEAGTFVDTSDEHDRTVARPRGLVDNATPSANAIGADVLQRLALLDRRGGPRASRPLDRPCGGAGPRAAAERLRPDAERGRSAARRADRRRRGRAAERATARGAARGGGRPVRARTSSSPRSSDGDAHAGGRCTRARRPVTGARRRTPAAATPATSRPPTRRGSRSRSPSLGAPPRRPPVELLEERDLEAGRRGEPRVQRAPRRLDRRRR